MTARDRHAPIAETTRPEDREGATPPPCVEDAEVAAVAPSFSRYMAHALFDERFGYYATGQVAFGYGAHFETFPQRMRPLFGRMVAEAAAHVLLAMVDAGQVPEGASLTLLELGAGNGDLAGDALDWIVEQRHRAPFDRIADRIQYVIGELAPALRERQSKRLEQHIAQGRARVEAIDARTLDWQGPFYGVLVANELIDAFPCDQLRIEAPGDVRRIHVLAAVDRGAAVPHAPEPVQERLASLLAPGERVLDARGDTLFELLAFARKVDAPGPRLREVAVPLSLGWLDDDTGRLGPVPDALANHLEGIAPLVDDLDALGLLPATLCWPTALPDFVAALARLLHGPERVGHALLIDYGGNARHVLDPRSMGSHLRVYGPDASREHTAAVYDEPGRYDITFDVDFTALGEMAEANDLAVHFFGHQSALERPPFELWSRDSQRILIRQRAAEGIADPMQQIINAHDLVQRFRQESFRLMVLGHPRAPFPLDRFGPPDAWRGAHALATLRPDASPQDVARALEPTGAALNEIERHLHAGGDPLTDLCDRRLYPQRKVLLDALAEAGLLVEPGGVRALLER